MSKSKLGKRGLGRGLSALMADTNLVNLASDPVPETTRRSAPDSLVPIEKLHPNPDQPRRAFTQGHMDELIASVKEKGIIQPLIVRVDPNDANAFQIVAGERRWRAAQAAGIHEIPVLIKELDDTEVLEIAIIENIQRANLNAVEEAQGYRQLMDRFSHTQERLAEALGKSRSHIANLLRLLSLPEAVLVLLRDEKISAGHARALITADNPTELANLVVAKGLSVRQVEKLAKNHGKKPIKRREISPVKDADTKALEADLGAALGMKVFVDHKEGGTSGSIKIAYGNFEQLDELCQILSSMTAAETK